MSDQKQILELLTEVHSGLKALRGDFDAFALKEEERWDANDKCWDANDKRWEANEKWWDALEVAINSRFDGIASLFLATERSHGTLERRVEKVEDRLDKLDPPLSESA